MAKFYVYYIKSVGYADSDGSHEAGQYFGWGDYRSTICVPIFEMEAIEEKEVVKAARKLFRKVGHAFTYTKRGAYRSVLITEAPIKEHERPLKKLIHNYDHIIEETQKIFFKGLSCITQE